MSAAMASFTETVHVRLLDEGTDVGRPAPARALGGDVYQLSRVPVPRDERSEFAPGSSVQTKQSSAGVIAVAALSGSVAAE